MIKKLKAHRLLIIWNKNDHNFVPIFRPQTQTSLFTHGHQNQIICIKWLLATSKRPFTLKWLFITSKRLIVYTKDPLFTTKRQNYFAKIDFLPHSITVVTPPKDLYMFYFVFTSKTFFVKCTCLCFEFEAQLSFLFTVQNLIN